MLNEPLMDEIDHICDVPGAVVGRSNYARTRSWSRGQGGYYRHVADEAADRDRRELLAVAEEKRGMVEPPMPSMTKKTALTAATNILTSRSKNAEGSDASPVVDRGRSNPLK